MNELITHWVYYGVFCIYLVTLYNSLKLAGAKNRLTNTLCTFAILMPVVVVVVVYVYLVKKNHEGDNEGLSVFNIILALFVMSLLLILARFNLPL